MKQVIIGTSGHIDHGKSTLVKALTGTDPDRLIAEKIRGITIELGFAHCTVGQTKLSFVDVPGHERFIKNMLAGASGIDFVMLVIAADESIMPQTREHFDICRLLQIPGGVVVLTKIDLVDAETIELVRLETRELITGSFLENAPIVPVSVKTEEGLTELRSVLAEAADGVVTRSESDSVRLPIDRVFSIKGFGTVVTGTQVSGRINSDSELLLLPSNRKVKIRGVQVHGERRMFAGAGQRVAVNLAGINVAEIGRGDTLATVGCIRATRQFDAVLELLPNVRPLRHGVRIRIHQGTSEVLGRVSIAGSVSRSSIQGDKTNKGDGARVSAVVNPGSLSYVRIRLEKLAVLTRGDRYIVRAYSPSTTIGGGYILDPQPVKGRISSKAARERFERLDYEGRGSVRLEQTIAAMINAQGSLGLPLEILPSRAGVTKKMTMELVERLIDQELAVRAGDVLVAVKILEVLKERLLKVIEDYHKENPLIGGVPREHAREQLFGRVHSEVFDRALQDLVEKGHVFGRGTLSLATHKFSLSETETYARSTIEQVIRSKGLRPPVPTSLAAVTGLEPRVTDRMVQLLIRQKVLVRIEALLFHSDVLQRLKNDVVALKDVCDDKVAIDVASFKERHGLTRKFAIPLLEYLDRERVTRRIGDVRVVI